MIVDNKELNSEFSRPDIFFWMVFASAFALFGWGLWSDPVTSHNEARRLIVIHEMFANHQWLTPMKNGVLYLDKPPLFYWVAILAKLISGSSADWIPRIPSALAALFTTGLLYQKVRVYIGKQQALFSALILISSNYYIMSARRAEINVFFGMLCFSALMLYVDYLQTNKKSYLYFSFFVLGLASLAKGPVALIFFVPPVLVYSLVRRDAKLCKGLLNPFGWLLFAVVGVSWFIYALYGVPDSPLLSVFQRDIVGKVYEDASRDPFYSYFVFLLGAFAPWILILFYKPKRWLKSLSSPEGLFLACAFVLPVLILSCFADKHGKYLIPAFPFLAAFLGCAVSDTYDNFVQLKGQRFQTLFLRLTGGLLVILFVAMVLAPPYVYQYQYVNLKPFAEKIRTLQKTDPVFAYHREEIQLIYYYGAPIPILDQEHLNEKLGQGQSFLLVARDDDQKLLEKQELCLLDEFKPYLKKDRTGVLYGTRNYCHDALESSSGLEAQPPSLDL